ncbi:aldo/keto reductase, partial [Halomonas sp. 707D4]
ADRHGVPPAEITLAWIKARGLVTIPSSTKARNIERNFKAFDIEPSEAEMADIATLDRGERIANPEMAPEWDQ